MTELAVKWLFFSPYFLFFITLKKTLQKEPQMFYATRKLLCDS